MSYHGDIRLGNTIDVKFTTRRFSTGAPHTLAGTPAIAAYVDNGTTEITAGITLSVDFDSRTGLNNVRVVATSGNGFAAGTDVELVITAGTVDSVSVVGEVIGSFSIENRSALMPTTAGRTLDVTATGAAGIDWGNVENPSTSVLLTGTAVGLVADVGFGAIDSGTFAEGAITANALATEAVEEIRNAITGGAWSLSTNSLGHIRVVDGTGAGELDLDAGVVQADIAKVFGDANSADWLLQITQQWSNEFILPVNANVTAVGGVAVDAFEGTAFRRFFGFDEPGHGPMLWHGSIQNVVSQTVFDLGSSASSDDDAYNGCLVRLENVSGTQFKLAVINDYVGATRRATLREDPGGFTIATGSSACIMADLTYWLTGPRLSAYGNDPTLFDNQVSIASNLDTASGVISGVQTDVGALQSLVGRLDAAQILMNTTISSLTSQTVFRLTAGSPDNDAYNGCAIVLRDFITNNQTCIGVVADYVGATREVTLLWNPGIYTIAAGDEVFVMSRRDMQGSPGFFQQLQGNEATLAGMIFGTWENVTVQGADILQLLGSPNDHGSGATLAGNHQDTWDALLAIMTDTASILGAIASLNDLSAAEVNAEMVDVLNVDAWAEPTGVPGSTASLVSKIGRLYKTLMRGVEVTATDKRFKDAGGITEWKKILTDNGTAYTEGSAVSP